METAVLIFLLFILILALFLGFELASEIPVPMRDSFLSAANILSGAVLAVTVLTAGLAYGGHFDFAALLGGIATALAAAAATGSYLLPDEFTKKEEE